MNQNYTNCPVCTYLNNSNNINCDCCDSPLNIELNIQNNPLETEFMQLTGEPRSVASEYLKTTLNNLDKAVGYYFEDRERNINNSDYRNNMINLLMNVFQNNYTQTEYQHPENIRDLTCQILYTKGINTPHECEKCDSKAFLISAKIISYESNFMNIIRMISQEDINYLKIKSSGYENLIKEIIKLVKEDFLPKIYENINKYIIRTYLDRKLLEKNLSKEKIEQYMDIKNGLDFRIIWDTLHQSDNFLNKEQIDEKLKLLMVSTEFHSYLNESWEIQVYNHPASSDVIKNLEKKKLIENSKDYIELKGKNCSICMEEFKPNGMEIIKLKCHSFCSDCILQWLKNHNDNCPVCRKSVTNDKIENESSSDIL